MIYNVLTIAGSDSGGGAGIQADLKAISANGAYGLSVITALTAQNTVGVQAVHPLPVDFVLAQLASVVSDIRIDAIKIGMLERAEIVLALADALAALTPRPPIVLDPVMVAKSGDALLHASAVAAIRDRLVPLATVITPNLPEAAALLGASEPTSPTEMADVAQRLLTLGPQAVLLKGGHLATGDCVDLLATAAGIDHFSGPRLATRNTHGTGCTLSAALAALIPQSPDLTTAARRAKAYVAAAIAAADQLTVGQGCGPVQHFHALWRTPAERTP